MMISTKGRYALRVMVDLAGRSTGGYTPLKEITARQNISTKYLEAILASLVKANFVVGIRGKGGGYRLSHEPREYTVGSILKTTEGSLAPVSCLRPSVRCEREADCPTRPVWEALDTLVDNYLESITLADLLTPDRDGSFGNCIL